MLHISVPDHAPQLPLPFHLPSRTETTSDTGTRSRPGPNPSPSPNPFPGTTPDISRLTVRELEVFRWIAASKSDWQIAQILMISPKTVNYHVENTKRKLDVTTRSRALMILATTRLLDAHPHHAGATAPLRPTAPLPPS